MTGRADDDGVTVGDLLRMGAALGVLGAVGWVVTPFDSRERAASRQVYEQALPAMGVPVEPDPVWHAESLSADCAQRVPLGVVHDSTYSFQDLPPAGADEQARRAELLRAHLLARGFRVRQDDDTVLGADGDELVVWLSARAQRLAVVAGPCALDAQQSPELAAALR